MTSYFVRLDERGGEEFDQILEPTGNLITGENDFRRTFKAITSLEADLLRIASSIFAADRATARGAREDVARKILISIPITNVVRLLPLKSLLEQILYTLSNDSWRVDFRQADGEDETTQEHQEMQGKVLLFSGGLDSLAAAVEFGQAQSLTLVSHKTHNTQTDRGQRDLVGVLQASDIDLPHHQFFVSSKDGGPGGLSHAEEPSQRTRSFLFLILGALVARRKNCQDIVFLAENGQMAIHLPLTSGRIGAFSTHTAHPDFLADMSIFLEQALGLPFKVQNPYVHRTKAEVIKPVVTRLPESIPIANSCWRNSRLPAGVTHCGECVPCYVRRIAIEYQTDDATAYGRDVWSEQFSLLREDDIGRRNLADMALFIHSMTHLSVDGIMNEWPELYSNNFDVSQVIEMYQRFCMEAREVLSRYSGLAELLE